MIINKHELYDYLINHNLLFDLFYGLKIGELKKTDFFIICKDRVGVLLIYKDSLYSTHPKTITWNNNKNKDYVIINGLETEVEIHYFFTMLHLDLIVNNRSKVLDKQEQINE